MPRISFSEAPPADQELSEPTLDPRTARCLINRFGRFPHAIGAMFAISGAPDALGTPCLCKLFFPWPADDPVTGLRIAADDPVTPVEIKGKLEELSALCEGAGMAAGARDQAHALPNWLVLLYNYNPRYFKSAEEGTFWVRNLALASIEYCQQFAFKKPGRPKRRASDGATLNAKRRGPGAPPKPSTDAIYKKWFSMGKPSAGILAMAIFPKEFEAADPEDRKKLTEKCRQAVRRCTKEPPI
jgi:hypothetical protein